MMVTEPSTPPIPAVITFITSPVGMPLANATSRLTTNSATKGCTFALMTINNSSTTPRTAISNSREVDMKKAFRWVSVGHRDRRVAIRVRFIVIKSISWCRRRR